ncbi:MAG: hypothetical protein KDB61_08125, partial [Planctomycetes bacterium]|nr:hypothetical protein [Planctomycetota bacterium]
MIDTAPIPQAAWNHLNAWIRDELAAQELRLKSLNELRDAMAKRSPEDLDRLLEKVQQQDKDSRSREARRVAVFESLGRHWGISPSMLTLRSIADRMGDAGAELMALRGELKHKAQEVSL